ncbi:MAG TPA: hypothetical protein VJX67_26595 [Blastocatellia bacterium]|nr:hypothetical protein [Blastocatellia bacterium]
MANVFATLKNKIIHFFHDTKAGVAIERIGIEIVSLPGFHDFLTLFKTTVTADVKAALAAIEHPTDESISKVLGDAVTKVKTDATAAVNTGLLGAFHGSWANFLVSTIEMEAKTELPNLLRLV